MHKFTIDICALVVSAIALGFAIWQGNKQIEHNHVSTEPRINSYFSSNGKIDQWGIYVMNNGLGPAFITDFTVFVDGEAVEDHQFGKVFSALLKLKLNPFCFVVGGPRVGDSIPVGDEIFLVEENTDPESQHLKPKSCPAEKDRLHEYQKGRLSYKMEFQSIYGIEFRYLYSENSQVKI